MRRGLAAALALGGAAALGLLLGGCGDGGVSLARQACTHVDVSLRLYSSAQKTPDPKAAATLLQQANNQLQTAEPLAAAANSANGEWNALMTTLQEIGRVDEGHLLSALRQQCAVAFSSQPETPPVPTTFPPVPSAPTTGSTSTTTTAATTTAPGATTTGNTP